MARLHWPRAIYVVMTAHYNEKHTQHTLESTLCTRTPIYICDLATNQPTEPRVCDKLIIIIKRNAFHFMRAVRSVCLLFLRSLAFAVRICCCCCCCCCRLCLKSRNHKPLVTITLKCVYCSLVCFFFLFFFCVFGGVDVVLVRVCQALYFLLISTCEDDILRCVRQLTTVNSKCGVSPSLPPSLNSV